MKFANPPLVELVAEVRWGASSTVLPASGQLVQIEGGTTNQHEESFMRFGSRVAKDGFDRPERLVPPGFPMLPGQVVYRYRYSAPDRGTSLYQIGPGVFSANITPPYDNWEKFKPVVESGLASLLDSRVEEDKAKPFDKILLRYIDAFRPELFEGKPLANFISDTLGFGISLPPVLKELVSSESSPKIALQLQLELPSNMFLQIQFGEGQFAGESSVLMDTVVSTTSSIGPDISETMAAFDSAHAVIRRIFLGLTTKITELMKPVQE